MEPIARFKFEGYLVTKSLLEIEDVNRISKDLLIDFDLQGSNCNSEQKFELTMNISVSDKTKNLKIEVEAIGTYVYDSGCDEGLLGNFFKMNAPAILFPYLRAHIATLSTLCGLERPLLLPTLNLSNLTFELSENTKTQS